VLTEETTPLTDGQKAEFEEQGFTTVPGVLSADQVADLRVFFEGLFDAKPVYEGDIQIKNDASGRAGGVRHDVATRYTELRFILTEPRILGALRSVLGDDFVFLPEMAAHDSRYGYWHKDTTPMERDGLTFHYKPDFRMVQCAIYFQDNDEHGGGLDVVPRSHRERDHTPPARRRTFLERVANRLGVRVKRDAGSAPVEPGAYTIPSKAGDLVIFNVLTNHQATQPANGNTADIPKDKRKFAMFFVCGANNEHTHAYREYIQKDYVHLRGDHRYPDEVKALAEANGLTLI
jgi:ectoine hydroxylase-related dioxygenase (phytanoyl-CoA dioxygenase family)